MDKGEFLQQNKEKAFQEAVFINRILDKKLINPLEIADASSQQINQLVARCDDLLTRNKQDGYDSRKKVETIIGVGETKNKSRLEMIVRACIFAIFLKFKYPNEFLGLVEYGSRTISESTPRLDSDQDILVFIKPEKDLIILRSLNLDETINKYGKLILGSVPEYEYRTSSDLDRQPEIVQQFDPQIC
ncbi:MAG: hypothetical protein WA152_01160, partial [Microgenomates group bacterium]